MSGPVTAEDADLSASASSPASAEVEITESRLSQVGALSVRRALPQRQRRTVGAWCFLDHGGPVEAPAGAFGIGPHPHIGLQTVTWILSGELLHRDSLGSEQPIRPGQLNLMTAGHGIVHAEEHIRGGVVHVVQLWVAQPDATREGRPAFEHHAELPQLDLGRGSRATVLVGSVGDARSRARRDTDHVGAEVVLRSKVEVPADPAYEHAVIALEGVVEIEGKALMADQVAYLGTGRESIPLKSRGLARLILLGGVPFQEPVLMWWNYVARTRDEIIGAHNDWSGRSERFKLPDSSLPPTDVGPPPWSLRNG